MAHDLVRIGVGVVAVFLAAASLFYSAILAAQPEIDPNRDLYALNRPAAFTFLDREGHLAGHFGAEVGERLSLGEVPPYLPAAFIAMEDRSFYQHSGFSFRAILRALVADVQAWDAVQGGSTITQQLVKMLYLTPERTFERKFREIVGAWKLERHLSKNEILELYLNRIYLGSGAYGVDGAARVYFGKSAREVTLAEAAMLAALTRAPSTFTPRRDLGTAQDRSKMVLDVMFESGLLAVGDYREALTNPAAIFDRTGIAARAYYFDAAADEVRRLLPGVQGDLIVRTTFDPVMQEQARMALASIMDERGEDGDAGQAALVSMSHDGAIRAIVGGRDYIASPFNRATQARRQPGSAFKPFVYVAALESGLRPSDVRYGGPVSIGPYRPGNYGGRNWGYLTLEDALRHSVNTIAVRVASEVGLPAVAEAARRLGIETPLHTYPSLPLGTAEVSPLEMTGAFAAFANGGVKATPYSVVEIRTPRGMLLYDRGDVADNRVLERATAETMNGMLYRVVEAGTGQAAQLPGREVAGKTGTSSDWRDAWFFGFTAQLVTGVWVGNDDFTPMKRITGGSIPARIWNEFMSDAHESYPALPLARTMPERQPRLAAFERDRIGEFEDRSENARRREERYAQRDEPEIDSWNYYSRYVPPPPPPPPAFSDRGQYPPRVIYGRQRSRDDSRRGRELDYWRGNSFADGRDRDSPYRQDWYRDERDERFRDSYPRFPDDAYAYDRGYAPDRYPPDRYQAEAAPETDRRFEADRTLRIIEGPDGGPAYSMAPVGH